MSTITAFSPLDGRPICTIRTRYKRGSKLFRRFVEGANCCMGDVIEQDFPRFNMYCLNLLLDNLSDSEKIAYFEGYKTQYLAWLNGEAPNF